MTAQSLKFRMERGDKILKLFDGGLTHKELAERFNIGLAVVREALRYARERRERAKERAE